MTRLSSRLCLGVLVVVLFCITAIKAEEQPRGASGGSPGQGFLLINESTWTDDDRQNWYHTTAGTQLMPYAWYVGLARGPLQGRLEATGVLDDPSHRDLAIGFGMSTGNGLPGPMVGLTCSFCHTTQFSYKGSTFRIDGGPSLQYNAKFLDALVNAAGALQDREVFEAFAQAVFEQTGQEPTKENLDALSRGINAFVHGLLQRGAVDISPHLWGPGRIDALGRGGNLVFQLLSSDNLRPANAPVSIPPLWGAWSYDRVQWGGSIRHPLARNIAQVIGVNANLFTSQTPPPRPEIDPQDPYRSSVDVQKLRQLEDLAKKLQPPRWPKAFPAIDIDKAKEGRRLYHDKGKGGLCAHCHVAKAAAEQTGPGSRLAVTVIPRDEVGTDVLYLKNFAARRVDTGALGLGILSAGKTIKIMTDAIMVRAKVMDDPEYRGIPNEWTDDSEYIARPHVAVWATAPYLHNGSVPTLYELLSPAKDRRHCFVLKPNMEFDPTWVGYAVDDCGKAQGFDFNTHLPGNGNGGHEFKNTPNCGTNAKEPGILGCEIPHEDRLAIIEYLKTCDLDRLVVSDLPPCDDLKQQVAGP